MSKFLPVFNLFEKTPPKNLKKKKWISCVMNKKSLNINVITYTEYRLIIPKKTKLKELRLIKKKKLCALKLENKKVKL